MWYRRERSWLLAGIAAGITTLGVFLIRWPGSSGDARSSPAPSSSETFQPPNDGLPTGNASRTGIAESKRHAQDEVRRGQRLTLERDIAAKQSSIIEKRQILSEIVRNPGASSGPNPPDFLKTKQELDLEIKILDRLKGKLDEL